MPTNLNTPTHLRPWSIIDDGDLALLKEIARRARGLQRGCDCEYDYRCGRCEDIIQISTLADAVKL